MTADSHATGSFTNAGARGWTRKVRPNGVVVAAMVLAALVMLPIMAVVASLFSPGQGSLGHLMRTVLPELLLNTFGLIVMVGAGTAFVGTGCAWLVSPFRFPGSRHMHWILLLPLAMPAYIIGYAYTDFLVYAGPLQTALRSMTGWTRSDYWFPEIHSLWGVSLMLVLVLYPYVYFLARTAFMEQSRGLLDVADDTVSGEALAFHEACATGQKGRDYSNRETHLRTSGAISD